MFGSTSGGVNFCQHCRGRKRYFSYILFDYFCINIMSRTMFFRSLQVEYLQLAGGMCPKMFASRYQWDPEPTYLVKQYLVHFFVSSSIFCIFLGILFIFRSARTSYRAFDSRLSVRPPATISPEFIYELKHCRQASGTPKIVYFLKAHDVSYPNSDENTNTKTETNKGKHLCCDMFLNRRCKKDSEYDMRQAESQKI